MTTVTPPHGVTELTGYENSVKPGTIVFFVLGLIIPFWIITLPLFWILAYQSYKSGKAKPLFDSSPRKWEALAQLKCLLDSGALTQEEYEQEKQRLLNPVDLPNVQPTQRQTRHYDKGENPWLK